MLVEDYADRVRTAAGHLTRLLADGGTRVDNPPDEPVGPGDDGSIELRPDAEIVQISSDPAPGVSVADLVERHADLFAGLRLPD